MNEQNDAIVTPEVEVTPEDEGCLLKAVDENGNELGGNEQPSAEPDSRENNIPHFADIIKACIENDKQEAEVILRGYPMTPEETESIKELLSYASAIPNTLMYYYLPLKSKLTGYPDAYKWYKPFRGKNFSTRFLIYHNTNTGITSGYYKFMYEDRKTSPAYANREKEIRKEADIQTSVTYFVDDVYQAGVKFNVKLVSNNFYEHTTKSDGFTSAKILAFRNIFANPVQLKAFEEAKKAHIAGKLCVSKNLNLDIKGRTE